MKVLKSLLVLLSLSVLLLLSSCASSYDFSAIDRNLVQGKFDKAYEQLLSEETKVEKKQGETVVNLDLGMLALLNGESDASNAYFSKAEAEIKDNFTKSITAEIATFVVNDNSREYPGEDYEDIYSNIFKSINYARLGSVEEAMVEIRRAEEKQQLLKAKYQQMMDKVGKNGQTLVSISFSHSALSSYLGLIFSRNMGNESDAQFFQRQVKTAFENQKQLYPFAVPSILDEELNESKGQVRINFLTFKGLAPNKIESVSYQRIWENNYAKIALPQMQIRPSRVDKIEVNLKNKDNGKVTVVPVYQIENISAIALETFKLRQQSIYTKTVVRSLIKAYGTEILEGTTKIMVENAKTAELANAYEAVGNLASIFSSLFQHLSEHADIRGSHYFPSQALIGGEWIAPGVYDIVFNFYSASGQLLQQTEYSSVKISSATPNFFAAVCPF